MQTANLTINKIDGYGAKLVAKGAAALLGLAFFGLLLILAAKRRGQCERGGCLAALCRVTGFARLNVLIRRQQRRRAEIWENSSAASYALQSLPAER